MQYFICSLSPFPPKKKEVILWCPFYPYLYDFQKKNQSWLEYGCFGNRDNCAQPHEQRGHSQYRNDSCIQCIHSDCLHSSSPLYYSLWLATAPREALGGKICHMQSMQNSVKHVAMGPPPNSLKEINDDRTEQDEWTISE